jgi:hypothetical protein
MTVCAILDSTQELAPDRELCPIAQWREEPGWRVGSARVAVGFSEEGVPLERMNPSQRDKTKDTQEETESLMLTF